MWHNPVCFIFNKYILEFFFLNLGKDKLFEDGNNCDQTENVRII